MRILSLLNVINGRPCSDSLYWAGGRWCFRGRIEGCSEGTANPAFFFEMLYFFLKNFSKIAGKCPPAPFLNFLSLPLFSLLFWVIFRYCYTQGELCNFIELLFKILDFFMSDKSRKSSRSALWHVGQQTRVYHTFLDVVDFKELLNATTGRMKKRSVFNERTEKASASQYFQVRIIKWLLETGDWSTFTVKFYSMDFKVSIWG